jgi:hypothetical protein
MPRFCRPAFVAAVLFLAALPAWAYLVVPLASGDIIAYPQPAVDQICFTADAAAPGTLVIQVYNMAKQHVATYTESVVAQGQPEFCEALGSLASGGYFYRASLGGTHFPTHKFWVARR